MNSTWFHIPHATTIFILLPFQQYIVHLSLDSTRRATTNPLITPYFMFSLQVQVAPNDTQTVKVTPRDIVGSISIRNVETDQTATVSSFAEKKRLFIRRPSGNHLWLDNSNVFSTYAINPSKVWSFSFYIFVSFFLYYLFFFIIFFFALFVYDNISMRFTYSYFKLWSNKINIS